MKTKIIFLVSIFLLCGCIQHPINGRITGKDFYPSHITSWLWCHPIGKVIICQPMHRTVPDQWSITIINSEDQSNVSVPVSSSDYNKCDVGEFYQETYIDDTLNVECK